MGQNGINNTYSSFYSINGNAPFVAANRSTVKRENKNTPVASVYLSEIPPNAPKKKKSNFWGWTTGIVLTLASLAVTSTVLIRSGNGKYLQRMQDALKRVNQDIAQGKNAKTLAGKVKYCFDVATARVLSLGNCLSNFTPYKDRFFDRLLNNRYAKALKLDKLPGVCRNLSKNISMRRNNILAHEAVNSADDLTAYIGKLSVKDASRKVTIGETTKTAGEWLKQAEQLAQSTKNITGETFGRAARDARFEEIDKGIEKLGINKKLEEKLFGIGSNATGMRRLRNIGNSIREGYQTEILTRGLRDKAGQALTDSCKPAVEKAEEISKILNAVYGDKAGAHVAEVNRYINALNKVTGSEKALYLRLAELKAGAALTDFGGLALAAGIGAYSVAKQDTKESMTAAALTSGIPICGGVGLCLLTTSLGMSGLVPLAIAVIGGKLLNICGAAVADKYIASAKEKKRFMDELMALRLAQSKVPTNNPFFSARKS